MSKFKDASDNIKRLQVMFKGLTDLADAMDSIDSLENHIAELENKKVSLIKVNDSLYEKQTELKTHVNVSIEDSKLIVKKALVQASEIQKDAQLKGDELFNKASIAFKNTNDLIEKKLLEADMKLNDKQVLFQNLDIEIELKSKKLEEINSALEKIKGGI